MNPSIWGLGRVGFRVWGLGFGAFRISVLRLIRYSNIPACLNFPDDARLLGLLEQVGD